MVTWGSIGKGSDMKKKLITAIVGALCVGALVLGGCSSSTSSSASTSAAQGVSTSSGANSSIEIGKVLFEDDYVAVTVEKFYTEELNWGDIGKQTEKFVAYKFKNKSDKKISLRMDNAYIGDDKAYVSHYSGAAFVDGGKNGTFTLMYAYPDGSKHKPLGTIGDLYKINGTITVDEAVVDNQVVDNQVKIVDEVSYSFQELK